MPDPAAAAFGSVFALVAGFALCAAVDFVFDLVAMSTLLCAVVSGQRIEPFRERNEVDPFVGPRGRLVGAPMTIARRRALGVNNKKSRRNSPAVDRKPMPSIIRVPHIHTVSARWSLPHDLRSPAASRKC